MRLGFLHTVPALADAFESDLRSVPGAEARHRVDPTLLARARTIGVDDVVDARVAQLVAELVEEDVDAVLVTCSSIGESAEKVALGTSVPVIRVDAAMAEQAVALASSGTPGSTGRISVLATVAATLGPTTRLLQRTAVERGVEPVVMSRLLEDALAARERGDQAEHDALIAEAVSEEAEHADVVVLAQASMAGAAAAARVRTPVLTSPASGLRSLMEAAHRGIGRSA